MVLESISSALNNTIEFLKVDGLDKFKGMFSIQFLAMAVMAIGILIAAIPYIALGVGFGGLNSSALVGSALIFLGLSVVVIIVAAFFSGVINSVSYNYIDSKYKKEQLNIFGQIGANIVPFLLYVIANILLSLVILGPFYLVYFAISFGTGFSNDITMTLLGSLIELLIRFVVSIVAAILHLFVQFAIFEVIVARNGVVESFKKSFNIVKNNLLETFLFSFLLWAIIAAITLAILLAVLVVGFVIGLVMFGIGMTLADVLFSVMGAVMIVALALIVIIGIIVMVAFAALQNLIEITAQYNYWKLISK